MQFEKPNQPLTTETEEPFEKKVREEDLIAALDRVVNGQRDTAQPEGTYERMHHIAEQSDAALDLYAYETGQWMTLEDIDTSVNVAQQALLSAEAVDEEERANMSLLSKLLEGRKTEVRSAIRRYVQTLIKFHSLVRHRQRWHEDEWIRRMEDVDHERRRNHDALISVVHTYNEVIVRMVQEGFLEETALVEWSADDTFSRFRGGNRVVVFGRTILGDREMVRRWATVASIQQDLNTIREREQKNDLSPDA